MIVGVFTSVGRFLRDRSHKRNWGRQTKRRSDQGDGRTRATAGPTEKLNRGPKLDMKNRNQIHNGRAAGEATKWILAAEGPNIKHGQRSTQRGRCGGCMQRGPIGRTLQLTWHGVRVIPLTVHCHGGYGRWPALQRAHSFWDRSQCTAARRAWWPVWWPDGSLRQSRNTERRAGDGRSDESSQTAWSQSGQAKRRPAGA
jgi:hypothetical protein